MLEPVTARFPSRRGGFAIYCATNKLILDNTQHAVTNTKWKTRVSQILSKINVNIAMIFKDFGGRVGNEYTLRSARTLLSRIRAPLPARWPDGDLEA
ncbi:hypothetical protein PoB_002664200 [Plakobranchus ocellatus]|uniref:Uncharacterized protein n=1 Tax=Plakobranchus ocellatus TaxID=259542 RepID=A0AAV3ZZM6_9GAST|nr:hypothetical protein PoB_002664200 [Plakobranchus ocellatus]